MALNFISNISKLKILMANNIFSTRHYFSSYVSGPLSEIKILDFSCVLAGPFATMILGDLGAQIIKIEKPDHGDDTRTWGPPYIGNESCYFLSVNRNKKSIILNLKKEKGIQIAKRLALSSDILVENFVPGVMHRLGLDYESLKLFAPRLIYCSISGYGSTGPYRERQGYDILAAAYAGLLEVTGVQDGEPCKVGVAMTDLSTGLYLHGAIMAALLERHKTNKGQKIECNLLSSQVSLMVNLASNYLNAGLIGQRRGSQHESIVPYQAFRTKDGYITVGAGNEKHFTSLCKTLHAEEILSDNKYKSNMLRVKNRSSLISLLKKIFIKQTNSEWLKNFEKADFPYAPVNSLSETFSDPQVIHNDIVKELPHSKIPNIKLVGPAVKFSESCNHIRSSPPALGEHTIKILQEEGYSSSEIEELENDGVIIIGS